MVGDLKDVFTGGDGELDIIKVLDHGDKLSIDLCFHDSL